MAPILLFDVNETLLDLSVLDARFEEIFGDSSVRDEGSQRSSERRW